MDRQYTHNPQNPQNPQTSQAQGNNQYELDSQQIAARMAFLRERQQRRNEHMQARIQAELGPVPVKIAQIHQTIPPRYPVTPAPAPTILRTAPGPAIQNQQAMEELRVQALRHAQASRVLQAKEAQGAMDIYRVQRQIQVYQQMQVKKARKDREAREAQAAKDARDAREAQEARDACIASEMEENMRIIRNFASNEGAFPLKDLDELLNFGTDAEWEAEEEAEVIVNEIARRLSGGD
ncbi:Protein of unknown function [Pyronema omphalodes CBS 100304]|uniref:Uncharacterized protein n=1 Tax=Pyronema omphalodes (strain CBS 100304) TaxID=1076935 RepID=U4LP20_PYROM|nr:Protein of unknown function [Pyronema omphalodes CBS 100304]